MPKDCVMVALRSQLVTAAERSGLSFVKRTTFELDLE